MRKRISFYQVRLERTGSFKFDHDHIDSPGVAEKAFREYLYNYCSTDRENFIGMYLNTKNQVAGISTIHVGSLNSSIVHPREVMTEAILHKAASVIVAHQHPSGNPTPSREDIEVTKRLMEVGEIIGISVFDHIILGENTYVSLKDGGYV
jgi:DNA repair protein RadC